MEMFMHLLQYLAEFFLEWKMFETKVVETIKTHILCTILFCRKLRCLWDNVEKYGRARLAIDDRIIRRMRCACWITKATGTYSEYVILIAFQWKQQFRERALILLFTYNACLFWLLAKECGTNVVLLGNALYLKVFTSSLRFGLNRNLKNSSSHLRTRENK